MTGVQTCALPIWVGLFGRPYYWFGGDKPEGDTHPGTDCGEIARGNISVTPLHLDLTAREELAALRKVVWN